MTVAGGNSPTYIRIAVLAIVILVLVNGGQLAAGYASLGKGLLLFAGAICVIAYGNWFKNGF